MKERAKRAGAQRKEEENERKSLQVIIIQNTLYIIIKHVSVVLFFYIIFSFQICVIYFCLLDQAGTDRG